MFLEHLDEFGLRFELGFFDLLWKDLGVEDLGGLGHHLGADLVSLLLGLARRLGVDEMLSQALLLDRHFQRLAQVHLKLRIVEHLDGDPVGRIKISHKHTLLAHDSHDMASCKHLSGRRTWALRIVRRCLLDLAPCGRSAA